MLIILLERGIPLFFKIQNSLWAILVCVLFYELGQYNLLKQITQANICTNTTANYMILIKILKIFFRVLKHPVNKDQLSLCRKQSSPYHIFYRLSEFDIPYCFEKISATIFLLRGRYYSKGLEDSSFQPYKNHFSSFYITRDNIIPLRFEKGMFLLSFSLVSNIFWHTLVSKFFWYSLIYFDINFFT